MGGGFQEKPVNMLGDVGCARRFQRRAIFALGLCLTTGLMSTLARAEGAIPTHRLPATLAAEAVIEAVAFCAKQGYAVSAVVVDIDAVRQAELRGDRAGVHTAEGAWRKAYTAVSVAPIAKLDSSAPMAERVKTDSTLQALEFQPGLAFIAGGLTIKLGDEVIGAIGVGGAPGGDRDEACARAGLDRIKNRLK